MHYEICFTRSIHDDRGLASRVSPNSDCFREDIILEELRSSALIGLPDLLNWSFPVIDESAGYYEISARFITLLPVAQMNSIFRLALGRGLKGKFKIRALPGRLGQFAAVN
jgi:hypothetical protein